MNFPRCSDESPLLFSFTQRAAIHGSLHPFSLRQKFDGSLLVYTRVTNYSASMPSTRRDLNWCSYCLNHNKRIKFDFRHRNYCEYFRCICSRCQYTKRERREQAIQANNVRQPERGRPCQKKHVGNEKRFCTYCKHHGNEFKAKDSHFKFCKFANCNCPRCSKERGSFLFCKFCKIHGTKKFCTEEHCDSCRYRECPCDSCFKEREESRDNVSKQLSSKTRDETCPAKAAEGNCEKDPDVPEKALMNSSAGTEKSSEKRAEACSRNGVVTHSPSEAEPAVTGSSVNASPQKSDDGSVGPHLSIDDANMIVLDEVFDDGSPAGDAKRDVISHDTAVNVPAASTASTIAIAATAASTADATPSSAGTNDAASAEIGDCLSAVSTATSKDQSAASTSTSEDLPAASTATNKDQSDAFTSTREDQSAASTAKSEVHAAASTSTSEDLPAASTAMDKDQSDTSTATSEDQSAASTAASQDRSASTGSTARDSPRVPCKVLCQFCLNHKWAFNVQLDTHLKFYCMFKKCPCEKCRETRASMKKSKLRPRGAVEVSDHRASSTGDDTAPPTSCLPSDEAAVKVEVRDHSGYEDASPGPTDAADDKETMDEPSTACTPMDDSSVGRSDSHGESEATPDALLSSSNELDDVSGPEAVLASVAEGELSQAAIAENPQPPSPVVEGDVVVARAPEFSQGDSGPESPPVPDTVTEDSASASDKGALHTSSENSMAPVSALEGEPNVKSVPNIASTETATDTLPIPASVADGSSSASECLRVDSPLALHSAPGDIVVASISDTAANESFESPLVPAPVIEGQSSLNSASHIARGDAAAEIGPALDLTPEDQSGVTHDSPEALAASTGGQSSSTEGQSSSTEGQSGVVSTPNVAPSDTTAKRCPISKAVLNYFGATSQAASTDIATGAAKVVACVKLSSETRTDSKKPCAVVAPKRRRSFTRNLTASGDNASYCEKSPTSKGKITNESEEGVVENESMCSGLVDSSRGEQPLPDEGADGLGQGNEAGKGTENGSGRDRPFPEETVESAESCQQETSRLDQESTLAEPTDTSIAILSHSAPAETVGESATNESELCATLPEPEPSLPDMGSGNAPGNAVPVSSSPPSASSGTCEATSAVGTSTSSTPRIDMSLLADLASFNSLLSNKIPTSRQANVEALINDVSMLERSNRSRRSSSGFLSPTETVLRPVSVPKERLNAGSGTGSENQAKESSSETSERPPEPILRTLLGSGPSPPPPGTFSVASSEGVLFTGRIITDSTSSTEETDCVSGETQLIDGNLQGGSSGCPARAVEAPNTEEQVPDPVGVHPENIQATDPCLCCICGKQFGTLLQYRVHTYTKHGRDLDLFSTAEYHQCRECPFQDPSQISVLDHESIHMDVVPLHKLLYLFNAFHQVLNFHE